MLRENQVTVLLTFFTICMNSKIQYWYDITGKTSFRDYVEEEGLSYDLIRDFFTRLKGVFDRLGTYLIDPDHILLNPDTVFLERIPGDFRLFLCYMPLDREDVPSGIESVTEFLTGQTGKGNSPLTELCFRMYDAALKERDAFEAVLKVLDEFEEARDSRPDRTSPVREISTGQTASGPGDNDRYRADSLPLDRQTDGEANDDRDQSRRGSDTYALSADEDPYGPSAVRLPEEDPWGSEADEDYDAYGDEEGRSLLDRLKEAIRSRFSRAGRKAEKKAENLFPVNRPDPESLDFEYDENDTLEQPTLLLSSATAGEGGRLLYEGNGSEKDYALTKDIFRIGSEKRQNDAVLHSPVVSRHHAKITVVNGEYFIEDLNSKNGTFVNGKMLSYRETMKLKRMDIITFADVVYRFV